MIAIEKRAVAHFCRALARGHCALQRSRHKEAAQRTQRVVQEMITTPSGLVFYVLAPPPEEKHPAGTTSLLVLYSYSCVPFTALCYVNEYVLMPLGAPARLS